MNYSNFIFFLIIIFSLTIANMYGYIDPGTGSYIIQVLIAGTAAGLYTIKVYWKSIKTFVSSKFNRSKK